MLLTVNVVANHKQPHIIRKLRNVGEVFFIKSDGIGVTEIFIEVIKFGEFCAFNRSSAVLVEAERSVIEIVACGNNKNLFAAFLPEIVKKF